MESSWRSNVWDIGLGGAGCTLCAPVLDIPGLVVTNGSSVNPEWMSFWLTHADTQRWEEVIFDKSVFAPLNFPYGYHVAPDVPG